MHSITISQGSQLLAPAEWRGWKFPINTWDGAENCHTVSKFKPLKPSIALYFSLRFTRRIRVWITQTPRAKENQRTQHEADIISTKSSEEATLEWMPLESDQLNIETSPPTEPKRKKNSLVPQTQMAKEIYLLEEALRRKAEYPMQNGMLESRSPQTNMAREFNNSIELQPIEKEKRVANNPAAQKSRRKAVHRSKAADQILVLICARRDQLRSELAQLRVILERRFGPYLNKFSIS